MSDVSVSLKMRRRPWKWDDVFAAERDHIKSRRGRFEEENNKFLIQTVGKDTAIALKIEEMTAIKLQSLSGFVTGHRFDSDAIDGDLENVIGSNMDSVIESKWGSSNDADSRPIHQM